MTIPQETIPKSGQCWPAKRTAFLIIHGIGEQLRFEILDEFAASCWHSLEVLNENSSISGSHVLRTIDGRLDHAVVLARSDSEPSPVEFREYYWADKAERLVDLGAIGQWLMDISEAAQRYYKENEDLAARYSSDHVPAFSGRKFKRHWYLRYLGWSFRLLSFLPSSVIGWVLRWLSPIFFFLNPLFRWIRAELIGYVGDIVVYTASDERSQYHQAREAILNGAVQAIRGMLDDPAVFQVVVAGHSLGSVIAYDALNHINQAMNTGEISPMLAKKIHGFVTFGSPLDKIAFFFREHTPEDEYLRRQILDHYHSFKAKPLDEYHNPRTLSNPLQRYLEHVEWVNFWDRNDPISGCLDFYAVDENIELSMGKSITETHTWYLQSGEMTGTLLKKMINSAP